MNQKTKFGKLPLGEPFMYNGVLFTKHSETQGLSQRLGFFKIEEFETVEIVGVENFQPIQDNNESPITFWGPFGVLVYAIACAPFIMLAVYLVVQYLWSAQ